MAVGFKGLPALHAVVGVRIGVAEAAIRKLNRRDLVVFELAPDSVVAAVFTRNAFCAAPVVVAKRHLQETSPRYWVVNTGNANAGTGARGMNDANGTCLALANLTGCRADQVLPFSTGVIGEPLPLDRLVAGLPAALANLSEQGWDAAAHGIMTTDTVPKGATRQRVIAGRTVTVTGIAKGSGMIRPDMATMLSYLATDAPVTQSALQAMLRNAVNKSFNRITVDGDTSTNDACVLVATGKAGGVVINSITSPDYIALAEAVDSLCLELAQAVVRDGEGATKFISVQVEGGRNDGECEMVAYAIAHSPLVKTALFASDPNWGRILAAVGRAGVPELDLDAVVIHVDDVCIVRQGGRAADYAEAKGQAVFARPEITISVNLARGAARTTVWTCDFSYDYVRINAEYRS